MKKLYWAILVIVLVFLALGCAGSNNTSSDYQEGDSSQVTQQENAPALEILNSKLVKEDYGGYSVQGTAKANKDLTYAEVSVKCYGADGAVIGSYITNMNNLKAGETWNFKVIGPFDDSVRVANYTIANGNSW